MRKHGLMTAVPLVVITSALAARPEAENSTKQNKRIAQRVIAMFNARDYAAADSLISQDHVNHAIQATSNTPRGPQRVKDVMRRIEAVFPDFRMELLDVIAEGDRVAYRMRFTGTHKGVYMGIPPTGNKVSFEAMHIFRIADGKVAEHWSVRDDLTRLRQIGQFPKIDGRRRS